MQESHAFNLQESQSRVTIFDVNCQCQDQILTHSSAFSKMCFVIENPRRQTCFKHKAIYVCPNGNVSLLTLKQVFFLQGGFKLFACSCLHTNSDNSQQRLGFEHSKYFSFLMWQIWQRRSTSCVVCTPNGRLKFGRQKGSQTCLEVLQTSRKADAKYILTCSLDNYEQDTLIIENRMSHLPG